MYASFHRYHGLDPARVQPMVDELERTVMPPIRERFGCFNTFVLVDRAGGCVTGVSLWTDESRMRESDQETARDRAALERQGLDWRREPQIERHEIVADSDRLLKLGRAAAAA